MIGNTILHYKISAKLGEGGMGVVYKAEDTKLKRDVAIKFLPLHIAASDEDRQRFKIEAQAAAALNHPNISHVYAIEEHGEELFIVMEYIEGRELKEIVETHKHASLPVETTIGYATQIASGLQAAHEKDIIHRDIKSSNIMVTEDGKIKIMDFGLAKIRGGAQFTKVGTTLGTAAYMSPEQARGEETDHRTDIWSFGVVLYEMLTGQLPFPGDYEQAVIYSIMNEEPEPLTGLRTGVPMELERIVLKALAKDPDERYQHVDEMIVDLKSAQTGVQSGKAQARSVIAKPKKMKSRYLSLGIALFFITFLGLYFWRQTGNLTSIDTQSTITGSTNELQRLAVLPFANLGSDPQTDYLGFALADQIIGSLAYMKNILVRPSSAVRKYQDRPVDAPTAGDKLRVDFILTGNYLKEADVVRLNVELVNVHSNEMLWREDIEVAYESAFKLQDLVSEKVVDGLKIRFSADERTRMQKNTPQNPLAYEYYLRSISFPTSAEGNRLALEMVKKSIELDSTYAPAFSELGFRTQQIAYYVRGEAQNVHQAEKAYLRALSLNNGLLSALGNLAGLYADLGKTAESVQLSRRSLQINPNNADSHFFLGYAYRYAGFLPEAIDEQEKALELDPGNSRFRSIGVTYIYVGEYQKALQAFELDSDSPWSISWKGQVYLRMKQPETALEYFNETLEMEPQSSLGLWTTGMKAAIEGQHKQGVAAIRKIVQSGVFDSEQWYNWANIYGLLGEKSGCVRLLRKAVEGGFFNYPLMLTDSFLDSVRQEPEFQDVLALAKDKHQAFGKQFFPSDPQN